MHQKIDYFFYLASPWCYLGHDAFVAITQKYAVTIDYKIIDIARLFSNSGALPLPQRPVSRQNYRLLELQRWREKRNLPLNLHPKFFPVTNDLANRVLVAILLDRQNPEKYIRLGYRNVWVHEKDITQYDVVREMLNQSGYDEGYLDKAEDKAIADKIAANTDEAIELDIVGVPGYVVDGEGFWGQDRLDLLEDMLASERRGFKI